MHVFHSNGLGALEADGRVVLMPCDKLGQINEGESVLALLAERSAPRAFFKYVAFVLQRGNALIAYDSVNWLAASLCWSREQCEPSCGTCHKLSNALAIGLKKCIPHKQAQNFPPVGISRKLGQVFPDKDGRLEIPPLRRVLRTGIAEGFGKAIEAEASARKSECGSL